MNKRSNYNELDDEFIFYNGMKIEIIPNTTTHLIFDDSFNEPIPNDMSLPTSITKITFGVMNNNSYLSFNQDLGDSFLHLTNLTHLTFGFSSKFNRSIKGVYSEFSDTS